MDGLRVMVVNWQPHDWMRHQSNLIIFPWKTSKFVFEVFVFIVQFYCQSHNQTMNDSAFFHKISESFKIF